MDHTDEPGRTVEGVPSAGWAPTRAAFPLEPYAVRRVSWGAVFAGVAIALVTQITLSLLGLAIGLGTIDPYTNVAEGGFQGLGVGTAIWVGVSTLIALFCGGLAAGRLAGTRRGLDGALHGIVVWALVTLASAWLMTTAAGRLVGGVANIIGDVAGLAGQGIAAVAPQIGEALPEVKPGDVRAKVEQFLRQTGDPALQPEALRREGAAAVSGVEGAAGEVATEPTSAGRTIEDVFANLAARGERVVSQVDREDAIRVVMSQTGKSYDESARVVDDWTQTLGDVREGAGSAAYRARATAERVTENVAGSLSTAAAFGFVALVLGCLAAAFGGTLGAPKERVLITARGEH
jgi:hypothetical protein